MQVLRRYNWGCKRLTNFGVTFGMLIVNKDRSLITSNFLLIPKKDM